MIRKLYILHKLPTPYNDDFFRALNADEEIDLQVFHLWKGSSRRPWTTQLGVGYPNYYMQPRFGIDRLTLAKAWSEQDSLFMIDDWAHIPTISILLARIVRGAPVVIWIDTPQEQLNRPFLKRTLRSWFLRWLLQQVDMVFASGKPARRALLKMGAREDRIVDFQFVVSLEHPASASQDPTKQERALKLRQQVGCQDNSVVFAMIGTIDLKKKAQDLGLRAFARALRTADRPMGLLVAGAGPELEQLQALARELQIEPHVSFLGWQEPDQMDSVYLAGDVLLHPAHYDPFPLVVVEAMNWSLPVIGTTRCGSVEERVESGVNGFAVPPGDEQALSDAMIKFANSPELLQSASKAARQTAETWPMSRTVSIVKRQMSKIEGETK